MKKALLLILAAVIIFALAACGEEASGEKTDLVDVTTEIGVSLKLPSSMIQQGNVFVNEDTGDSVTFAVVESSQPIGEMTEEYILALYSSRYEDVVVESFDNQRDINGKEALVSKVSLTTPNGNRIIITLVIVTDGQNDYVLSFVHGKDDTEGALVKNLDASIRSITILEIENGE